ncbi:MAG: DUF4145 domain-containing protein [Planctomycetota bacterium]
MKPEYVLPANGLDAFNCVNCHVYCRQVWFYMHGSSMANGFGEEFRDSRFLVSQCERCRYPTIWLGDRMLFPNTGGAEPPNPDLPADIKNDYEEARAILAASPRGSAALLRLAIQRLCSHLGQPGKNINDDVAALVAAGLPPRVQEALDSVRVIGNEAVHPGAIDLRDNRAVAGALFKLVNFIATKLITEPNEISSIYGSLPKEKLDAIAKRDKG